MPIVAIAIDMQAASQIVKGVTHHSKAPINPANYAAVNYNPTYTQAGAVGRFFRAGVNISFRPKERVAPAEPFVAPPAPPEAPATQTCADGSVILATATCAAPPPPPPPAPAPERG